MKKIYLKPEMISLNFIFESIIATSGGNQMSADPDEEETEFSGRHRGEWGNVWGK